MTNQRIFLDSAMGGLPTEQDLSLIADSARFLTLNPTGIYSEARRADAINRAALQQVADYFQLPISQVLPVHNFAAAIDFLCSYDALTSAHVSVSRASRQSLLNLAKQKLHAREAEIDFAGNERGGLATWHITQAGNPETGNIAPLELMSQSSRLIVDATEWVGRMSGLPSAELIIVRATSWGAPTQICFLLNLQGSWDITKFDRQRLQPSPALLAASAQALRSPAEYAEIAAQHRNWLDTFSERIKLIPGISLPTETELKLPHLLSFMVAQVDAEVLAQALDQKGFAVGSGSACGLESGVSHVLAAMGFSNGTNIRIGLPLNARQADLEKLAEVLPVTIQECLA